MKQKIKPIPDFKTEDEEFEFWSTHDLTDYFDMSNAQHAIFPNLKRTTNPTKTISIRMMTENLAKLKVLAKRQDVPYQSLMKMYLAERINKEWKALSQ